MYVCGSIESLDVCGSIESLDVCISMREAV